MPEALAIPGLNSAAAERAFPGVRSPTPWRSSRALQGERGWTETFLPKTLILLNKVR